MPTDTYDRSFPYYQWWPKKGGTEWISYEYENPKKVSSSSVYWYDDGPWGGCRLPKNWKLYYKDMSGNWNPIKILSLIRFIKEFATKSFLNLS